MDPADPLPGSPGLPDGEESGKHVNYWEAASAGAPGAAGSFAPTGAPSGKATAALVCGIAGLCMGVCCCGMGIFGIGASIVAAVLGSQEVKDIEAGRSDPAGIGQARTGRALGIAGIVLNAVIWAGLALYYAIVIVVAIAAS
jgi:hypothetical protein